MPCFFNNLQLMKMKATYLILPFLFFGGTLFSQNYKWQSVRISGGGNVTSITFHPKVKDVIYITTDVGTPWRWNAKEQKWEDMMLFDKIPVKYWRPWLSQAASNIAIDPNDKTGNILYATVENGDPATFRPGMGKGGVLKSYDRGKSWTDCELLVTVLPNENRADKGFINRIVVDPNNSNIIYVLTHEHGTYINEKAGLKNNWRKINTGLADTSYRETANGKIRQSDAKFILLDPSQGKINNRTKVIYIGYSGGVLMSNDGGKIFSKMQGSPAAVIRGSIAKDGTMYVSYDSTFRRYDMPNQSGIFKWNKKEWINVTPQAPRHKGQYYKGIDVNPANSNEVVASERGTWNRDNFYRSKDGGKTWQVPAFKIDNTEAPHSGFAKPSYDNNAFGWDPHRPGNVWYVDMLDVGHTKNVWADTIQWKLQDKGLEEVIVTGPLTAPHSGKNLLLSSTADIGGADHRSVTGILKTVMNHFFFGESTQGTNVTDAAYQYTDPNFIVRVGGDGWALLDTSNARAGYSTDGGDNYTRFKLSPGVRGRVAVSSDSRKIVWLTQAAGKQNGEVWWSHDLGDTWTKSEGLQSGIMPYGSQWNVPAGANYIVADKADGNTFYLYDRGKLFASVDGGKTFELRNSSLPELGNNPNNNNSAYAVYSAIETTPGKKGDIWISFESIENSGLYHSADGGKTFEKVNPDIIKAPKWIAIGKDKPDGKIVLYTTSANIPINGIQYGVFRSDDWGKTWKNIANPAPGVVMNLAADFNGRIFMGVNGVGIFYGEPVKK